MASLRYAAGLIAAGALCACGLSVEGIPGQGAGASSSSAGATGGAGDPGGAGGGATSSGSTVSTTGAGGSPPGCDPGFECIAAASAGEYVRAVAGAPASCPAGWQDPRPYGDGIDPGCDPCSCASPPAGTCALGVLHGYTQANCGNQINGATPPDTCWDFPATIQGIALAPSTPSAASCQPAAPGAPAALVVDTLCRLVAAAPACDGGVCVPIGGPGFGPACALLPAGGACDPGWGAPVIVAEILSDTRACSCSCGASAGQTCAGAEVDVWSNGACSGAGQGPYPADGSCYVTPTTNGSLMLDAGTWTGGACPPMLQSSGAVAFAPSEVLCCPPPAR